MGKFINSEDATKIILSTSDYAVAGTNSLIGSRLFKVEKVSITNYSTGDATVSLYLDGKTIDGTAYEDFHLLKGIIIPSGVTLVWDDSFSMNPTTHSLKIDNTDSNSTPKLTIRIDT